MAKVTCDMAMSVDGFVAGPNQGPDRPFGDGVDGRLHRWMFEEPYTHAEELARIKAAGAFVMGRNMFGGHPGPWDSNKPWNGWWGENPPFHHPVFVLTHHAREPLALDGGTTFLFVTDGIESALEQARQAAGGKDVSLAGGAKAAQQYLAAGLVDEMEINLAPTLLGSGERLFDGVGDNLHGLELVRTVAAPKVTHLKFAKR